MSRAQIVSINVQSLLDPARFRDLYNMMQSSNVDVVLAQEAFLTETAAREYEATYPLVAIAAHKAEQRGGVATIINCRTTEWLPTPDDRIVHRDSEGRLLICQVRCRGTPIQIGNVYAPAESKTLRAEWYRENAENLSSLGIHCDLVGGDWNETTETISRLNLRPPSSLVQPEMQKFTEALEGVGGTLVDGWREQNPQTAAFTYFREGKPISRLDRIYVRSDWMRDTEGWDIQATGLRTDHHAVCMRLRLPSNVERGPGRWRLDPNLLKTRRIRDMCTDALHDLPGRDPISEWATFKICARDALQREAKALKKANNSLRVRIARRRKKLWNRRVPGRKNPALEKRLAAVTVQEQCLEEWHYKSYSYNALAKHMLLDEKPTKWFFSKARYESNLSIEGLKDGHGDLHTTPDGILRAAAGFYEELYAQKPSDKEAADHVLGCIRTKISPEQAEVMTRDISVAEVRGAIRRAALGKSPGPDGLPVEFYRSLLQNRRKKGDGTPEVVKRLQGLFNAIQNGGPLPPEWTDGVLTLLYKNKGDKNELKNYRPLSIMNVDYKLYTEILMRRLVKALETAIGPQQSAFLPGRLIDDNIRTIQGLIARERLRGEGLGILFLDQEKAYDRVSHKFMWRALRRLGIPRKFITWIKLLYKDARIRPFINGFMGPEIRVQCGVRQGDPLSCPLFLVIIEGLACAIMASTITGKVVNGVPLKTTMYADDTTVILQSQEEVAVLLSILKRYGKASGSRVNWPKSFLLRMGALELYLPEVQTISAETRYEHLGIPVGEDLEMPLKAFWDNMLQKFRKISAQWMKCHMSLQGRVLVANAMMMSITRYALRFLDPPVGVIKDLSKEYYRLVWDDRASGTIKDLYACCPISKGGIGCFDLATVADASVIAMVVRSLKRPEDTWVQLGNDILVESATVTNVIREAVNSPWFQWLKASPTVPFELRGQWNRWRRINGARFEGFLQIQPPRDRNEALNTYFWYHPIVGVSSGGGARRWGSVVWRTLWSRGARVLGDIWDSDYDQPKLPEGLSAVEADRARKAIRTLMDSLPEEWVRSMNSGLRGSWRRSVTPRQEYTAAQVRAGDLSYNKAYKMLLKQKLKGINFNDRAMGPIEAYRARTGVVVRPARLWRAARDALNVKKAGDLLWRMLHGRVLTGKELHWIDPRLQLCPLHQCDLSIHHVWIECTVAGAVWREAAQIWRNLRSRREFRPPRSQNEMVALTAFSPNLTRAEGRRWHAIYRTAVWCIWKAYLSYSFEMDHLLWSPDAATTFYREFMGRKIMTERTLSLSERYQNKEFNEKVFQAVWGQRPQDVKVLKGPDCLKQEQNG